MKFFTARKVQNDRGTFQILPLDVLKIIIGLLDQEAFLALASTNYNLRTTMIPELKLKIMHNQMVQEQKRQKKLDEIEKKKKQSELPKKESTQKNTFTNPLSNLINYKEGLAWFSCIAIGTCVGSFLAPVLNWSCIAGAACGGGVGVALPPLTVCCCTGLGQVCDKCKHMANNPNESDHHSSISMSKFMHK